MTVDDAIASKVASVVESILIERFEPLLVNAIESQPPVPKVLKLKGVAHVLSMDPSGVRKLVAQGKLVWMDEDFDSHKRITVACIEQYLGQFLTTKQILEAAAA